MEAATAATRLPKVASDAKMPTQPSKPIDRSSLLQAYQKKISSGKEKDIINLIVVGGFILLVRIRLELSTF